MNKRVVKKDRQVTIWEWECVNCGKWINFSLYKIKKNDNEKVVEFICPVCKYVEKEEIR